MIVKDEERHLARCLRSLSGIADEIVVVDTGSRDGSLEIARSQARVRLTEMPWPDDFAAARNESVGRAQGEWILVVDADEEVVAPAGFRKTLARRRAEGLRVRIVNEQPPGALTRSEDLEVVRLFRNHPEHRFEGRVHEQVAPSIRRRGGKIGRTDLVIRHHGYASREVQAGVLRTERNLELISRELAERPDDYYLHFQLGATLKVDQPERARLALERALETAPSDASPDVLEQTHMKLAQIALERGDLVPCAEHAVESIILNERNVTSRVCVIVSAASLGRLDVARPHLEWMVKNALDEVPNPDDFRELLARARENARD
jgi:glycosyltransferase involved in cell wall biosynthesis